MPNSYTFNLHEEAEYVLGMMDLYQNESQIADFLKMKGLSEFEILKVLEFIKKEGYQKRIRQAKKIFIIGAILMVCLGAAWFFLSNSSIYNKRDELIERTYARMMIRFTFYGFLYGIFQTGFGIYRYFIYYVKLKRLNTT